MHSRTQHHTDTLILVSVPALCYYSSSKKDPSHCQKCRWQVAAKHTCTQRLWHHLKWQCQLAHGVWRTQNVHQDGSSFTWHHVTAVARKGSESLCQKCRWQDATKLVCTQRLWHHMKCHCKSAWFNCMEYTEHSLRWAQFYTAPAL